MPDIQGLLQAIDAAEARSYGGDKDATLSTERALSIDFFLGNNVEPAPEGQSQVVDRTVFETIQGLLPSLARIFAGGDNVVEFEPLGPDDEQAAEQESDYLNYVVTQKNDWFGTFTTWAQDALLSKNGYCMAFMDETITPETETYENQSEEQIAMLLSDGESQIVAHEEYPDPDGEPAPLTDEMGNYIVNDAGMVVMAPPMLHNVQIRRVRKNRKLCLKVLPPERCQVSERTPDHTLRDCPYFEYWDWVTISDVRRMGYDIPDDIASDDEADEIEDEARDRYTERLGDRESFGDAATRRIRFRVIWVQHDYDEDGIAELQMVYRVGSEILFRQEVSRIHVACLVPHILTHRHIGISEVDITGDLQREKTAIKRRAMDNLHQSQNMRMYINADKVNLEDAMVNAPGAIIRNREGQDAVYGQDIAPIMPQFLFPEALQGLDYLETVTERRTGLNRNFTGVNEEALRGTATAVNQLSTMSAQRVEHMARLMATGVKELFSICHELILKHGHQAETVRLRGQWVSVDPRTWKTGRDMKIAVGFGAGNKDAVAARLGTILAWQEKALTAGLRVVSEQNVYETLNELVKVSDFNSTKFFTDPATLPPPAPPPPDPLLVNAQADRESTERVKAAELDEKARETDINAKVKMYEIEKRQETELLLERIRSGEKIELEKVKADLSAAPPKLERELRAGQQMIAEMAQKLANQLEEVDKTIKALKPAVEGPREIVKDKSGKIIGVMVNGVLRKAKRNSNGDLTGVE